MAKRPREHKPPPSPVNDGTRVEWVEVELHEQTLPRTGLSLRDDGNHEIRTAMVEWPRGMDGFDASARLVLFAEEPFERIPARILYDKGEDGWRKAWILWRGVFGRSAEYPWQCLRFEDAREAVRLWLPGALLARRKGARREASKARANVPKVGPLPFGRRWEYLVMRVAPTQPGVWASHAIWSSGLGYEDNGTMATRKGDVVRRVRRLSEDSKRAFVTTLLAIPHWLDGKEAYEAVQAMETFVDVLVQAESRARKERSLGAMVERALAPYQDKGA